MSFAGRRGHKVLCDKGGGRGAKKREGEEEKNRGGGLVGCIKFALSIFTTFGSDTFAW